MGTVVTHSLCDLHFVEPEEIDDLMETTIKNGSINGTTLVIDGGLGAPKVRQGHQANGKFNSPFLRVAIQ